VLYRHIPRALVDRPKMGFGIPLDSWLRGPLRPWAEELLNEQMLREQGIFEPKLVRQRWAEFLAGRQSWQYHLWAVLMFQSWYAAEQRELSRSDCAANLAVATERV
jgi:asparagine synthase (glutamine-hydrolysing)